MSVPSLSASADMVRRLDPDLFHTALFAPEPARERLMVLYAFDIALSQAAARASEPMIAAMRLQWWRDVLDESRTGKMPHQHEVAAPLHALLQVATLDEADLDAVIDGHGCELEGPFDAELYARWADARFGALTRLACAILVGPEESARRAATAVGQARAAAFVLRHAMRMAVERNAYFLPDLAPEERAALARGKVGAAAQSAARDLASQALAVLKAARAERRAVPKAALPALIPVGAAERVLRAGRLRFPTDPEPRFRGPRLIWRAMRGRW